METTDCKKRSLEKQEMEMKRRHRFNYPIPLQHSTMQPSLVSTIILIFQHFAHLFYCQYSFLDNTGLKHANEKYK